MFWRKTKGAPKYGRAAGLGAPQSQQAGEEAAVPRRAPLAPIAANKIGAKPAATAESLFWQDRPEKQRRAGDHAMPSSDDVFSLARHNKVDELAAALQRDVRAANRRDAHGNTVLMVACQNGHKNAVKAALRKYVDLDAQNNLGNTALHFCYAFGFNELADYLVGKGADLSVRNNKGQLCFQSKQHQHQERQQPQRQQRQQAAAPAFATSPRVLPRAPAPHGAFVRNTAPRGPSAPPFAARPQRQSD